MSSTAAPTPAVRAAAESSQAVEAVHPHAPAIAGYNGTRRVPTPVNEPVKSYAPGSPERAALKNRARRRWRTNASRFRSSSAARSFARARRRTSVMPHDHRHVLADWHKASATHVRAAIDAARTRPRASGPTGRGRIAPRCSSARPSCSRRRGDPTLNASTMLGQSKTVVPGGDRRGVRADRLLALQPGVRAGAVRRAAAVERRRCGTSSTIGRSRDSCTR